MHTFHYLFTHQAIDMLASMMSDESEYECKLQAFKQLSVNGFREKTCKYGISLLKYYTIPTWVMMDLSSF